MNDSHWCQWKRFQLYVQNTHIKEVQKTAKPSAAQSSTKSADTNPATDDDDCFGLILAAQMRHIKTSSVNRELKRKLWDLVVNAQAEDEQLQNLQVVTWFVDPATAAQ